MGNTPSSSSTLKRNRTSVRVSRPRNLGAILNAGPDVVFDETRSQLSTSRRSNDVQLETSTTRRAQSLASAVPTPPTVTHDVDEPAGATLPAPPPYSEIAAGPSNRNAEPPVAATAVAEVKVSPELLQVPVQSSSVSTRSSGSHRRSASYSPSSSTPDLRQDVPRRSHESSRQHVSEGKSESGYGVGQGLKALPTTPAGGAKKAFGSRHAQVVMLPPRAATTSAIDLRSSSPGHRRQMSLEDPLESLKKYNVVFIVDDSSSMMDGGWMVARKVVSSLAEIAAKYDARGVDVHFLNSSRVGSNIHSSTSVKRLFDATQPSGVSLVAAKLEELLLDYLTTLESAKKESDQGRPTALNHVKPVNYIIFTDGTPTDDPEPVIVQAARRLDNGNFPVTQIGIQFVQLGANPRAYEAMRELDDELAKNYSIRDMVDATQLADGNLDQEAIIKVLLGGINRRVDNKGARSVM